KSRLLAEFLRQLDIEGLLGQTALYQTACSALGSEAYHVPIDFFRACFALTPEDNVTQARTKIVTTLRAIGAPIESIVPVVEDLLGFREKELRLERLDPEQLKRQLFLTVKEICQYQSRHRSVLLIVEDFQWADAASVELLRSLVERIPDRPLMLLLVARLTAQMGTIYSANVDVTALRLQPLTPEDSETLLEALLGPLGSPFQPVLREVVTRRAAGNPFFLEEAIHSLIDKGILIKTPQGAYLTEDLTNLEVPATVQGVILSRLDSLEPGAKYLLLEAAVIGPSFDPELLRHITAHPGELPVHLETLLRADLLSEVSATGGRPPEYCFRNGLIQEVAYNNLLRTRRTPLHGQIARTLERLHTHHIDEYLPQLAHHYSLSDDQERAFQYLLRSGDKATRIYANQDAVGCYRRALEILAQQGDQPALKAEVLEKLDDAHSA